MTHDTGGVMASTKELLDELERIDTPSVTNVVATYPSNPLCLGIYNPGE